MQIVIDIPEELYDWIEHTGALSYEDCGYIGGAILDGTPLPKGHGRLIDVSEYYKGSYNDAREFLDNAPTIIEADKVGDTNGNS